MGDIILSGGAGGSSSGGDGAILDGVSSSIKATVLDLTDSNPVTVAIVDTNGDQITSFGGGTQYTEDVASAADPVGTAIIGRRRDTLASEVDTDGDNVALNATAKGELYVKHADAIPVTDNSGSLTVDGTVTANQGTPNSTANRWPVQITDGTDLVGVSALGELIVTGDVTITAGSTIGITSIFQDTQPTYTNLQEQNFPAMSARGALLVNPGVEDFPVTVPTGGGRTLEFVAISQGGAGTTTLVSADATKKIKVVSYVFVMSATGTAKFIDSTPTDLTGAMPIATNGGVSAIGTSFTPLFQTAVNKSLQIVTTTGAATGHLAYYLEA